MTKYYLKGLWHIFDMSLFSDHPFKSKKDGDQTLANYSGLSYFYNSKFFAKVGCDFWLD